MSEIDRKIKEILAKAKGQGKLTEQAVRTLIERDHKFTLGLVAPYLDGIIAHAIERARKQAGLPEPAAAAKKPAPVAMRTPAPKPKPVPLTTGGLDGLLSEWAKKFETEPAEKNAPGTKVSDKHIQAMNALVKKTKK